MKIPNLPEVYFAPLDVREIEQNILSGFENASQEAGNTDFNLYPGDPRRLFLESVALMIIQQNNLIDRTGKSNLLRYAKNDTIEEIGWLYGERGNRLMPKSAQTILRYSLSTSRDSVTVIPKNSRVSTGNKLHFMTVSDLYIQAGNLFGDVLAICEKEGTVGNGYLAGQISTVVDREPFVEKAENIVESSGGANKEGLEPYRMRIRDAPESFSVAGPEGAYVFWAKSANAEISDVAVWTPQPGHVNIAPLMKEGKLPSESVLTQVIEKCNNRKVRPLTDFVNVVSPTIVDYSIDFDYWILEDDKYADVKKDVEESVKNYIRWQREKLGRDINPSELHRKIINAGAKRTFVNAPIFTATKAWEIANLVDCKVVFRGNEHE